VRLTVGQSDLVQLSPWLEFYGIPESENTMTDVAPSIGQEFRRIAAFVGIVWGVFMANWFVSRVDLNSFGLVPRTLWGTVGIVSMPFLHASWGHLLGNTVPLIVLLVLLAGSKARSWEIVAEIVVASGALLWIFGRNATHVGASALIFGLATFLIISGVLEKRITALIVSLIVGVLYGGTLIWGVLPGVHSQVSWDGHLCGAIAGGLSAWSLSREAEPDKRASVAG
jgi:membrane associated rhomboid family serine protease